MIEGSRQVGGEAGTVWGRPERGSIDRGGRDFEEKNYRFRLSTVDMRDLVRLQWWTRFEKCRDFMKLLPYPISWAYLATRRKKSYLTRILTMLKYLNGMATVIGEIPW